MTVEVSVVGLDITDHPSTHQSVAQQTGRCWHAEMRPGSTVTDLIKRLGVPDEDIQLVLVNGRHADRQTVLQEGDAVELNGQVSGD